MLAQTSEVLEAPRTLLVWEEADEPWTEVAIWDEGRVEQTREAPGGLGDVVERAGGGGELLLPRPGRARAADVHSRAAWPRDVEGSAD